MKSFVSVLCALLVVIGFAFVASDSQACPPLVQQFSQGHCVQQQFVSPVYAVPQAVVVSQYQPFFLRQQVVVPHHQAIVQKQVIVQKQRVQRLRLRPQVTRQRIVTRTR